MEGFVEAEDSRRVDGMACLSETLRDPFALLRDVELLVEELTLCCALVGNLLRDGGALFGGVAARECDSGVSTGGASSVGGGTVTERNVSTKRELMTLSSPFCELSGIIFANDAFPEALAGTAADMVAVPDDFASWELTEDAVEIVRTRFPGRIVGPPPEPRLIELGVEPTAALAASEKLTLEAVRGLALGSGGPLSSLEGLPEFAEALRPRLRPRVMSKSSET